MSSNEQRERWRNDRKTRRQLNGEYYRLADRAQRFGMTAAQLHQLHGTNRCAICGTITNKLVIEHNHKTGKFRALTCRRCNFYIGIIESDPDLFCIIMEYIALHNEE